MFLVLADAHSKWPEVCEVGVTTATKTIKVLHQLFSTYGLPEQVVFNNGPQFVSEEFATFARQNGIRPICIAPYHLAFNGAVEQLVQSFKQVMSGT